MKKKAGRLVLSRETLRMLSSATVRHAAGGTETAEGPECNTRVIFTCGDVDSAACTGEPSIFNTCAQCSSGCATGGACTVAC